MNQITVLEKKMQMYQVPGPIHKIILVFQSKMLLSLKVLYPLTILANSFSISLISLS